MIWCTRLLNIGHPYLMIALKCIDYGEILVLVVHIDCHSFRMIWSSIIVATFRYRKLIFVACEVCCQMPGMFNFHSDIFGNHSAGLTIRQDGILL